MKTLFYRYNAYGSLVFKYRDEQGTRIERTYLFYTLREAIQRFRNEYNLQHKHIELIKL